MAHPDLLLQADPQFLAVFKGFANTMPWWFWMISPILSIFVMGLVGAIVLAILDVISSRRQQQ